MHPAQDAVAVAGNYTALLASTALRLGRYFGVESQFWLNLQSHYDLEREKDLIQEQVDAITPLQSA